MSARSFRDSILSRNTILEYSPKKSMNFEKSDLQAVLKPNTAQPNTVLPSKPKPPATYKITQKKYYFSRKTDF